MSYTWPTDFWQHQARGCEAVVQATANGQRRIVLSAPTGMGKTRCACALIEWATSEFKRTALYTHRRILLDQTSRVLTAHGIEHGMRAAGHDPHLLRDVQLCMTQTEGIAVYKRERRELHPALLAIADELHAQGGDTLPTILEDHHAAGAAICGLTATPIDLTGEWDTLIVAGSTSEGRKCGALVPAYTHCPDVPDLRHIKKYRVGEDLTDKDNRKVMMRPGVFGRILTHYNLINPDKRPTILFAPDVAGSIYFAEQFWRHGIRAAHIDAKQVWIDDEYEVSNDENRAHLLRMFENGEIDVLCNRFVCLDSETEILTDTGWVGKDAITRQHRVANWIDGHVYFDEPKQIIRRLREPDEYMVSLETPRRSIRVTADHELLYSKHRQGPFIKTQAARLVDESLFLPVSGNALPHDIAPAQQDMLANLPRRVTANAFRLRANGWPPDDSRAEAERRLRARASLRRKLPSELSLDECEFIGLWIGDGNVAHLKRGGVEYRLWQPSKYENITARIDSLTARLGYDVVRREGAKTNALGTFHSTQWSFSRGTGFGPQVRHGLYAIEPYLDKSGSQFLWGLTAEQFKAMLHGLWLANGMQHRDRVQFPAARLMIWGANKKLFDLLQAIATCRGWRASIRTYPQTKKPNQYMHLLTLSTAQSHACTKYRLQIEEDVSWMPEEVWCVTTSSGNIITRRHGSVTVMGNCREGLDIPCVGHAIFACVFGSLRSYLQAGGRALRAHPSLNHVTIQDHGGSYIRHGSLNEDREWKLGMTGYKTTGLRLEAMRENPELEPIICPKCHMARLSGPRCPHCGHACFKRSRFVVQIDGTLKAQDGPSFKPRRIKVKSDTQKVWDRYFHGARIKGRTVNQAMAWMFYNEHYWPPRDLKNMPTEPADFFEHICDIPKERLR